MFKQVITEGLNCSPYQCVTSVQSQRNQSGLLLLTGGRDRPPEKEPNLVCAELRGRERRNDVCRGMTRSFERLIWDCSLLLTHRRIWFVNQSSAALLCKCILCLFYIENQKKKKRSGMKASRCFKPIKLSLKKSCFKSQKQSLVLVVPVISFTQIHNQATNERSSFEFYNA